MPLVVPGLIGSNANNNNISNSQQEEWLNKLVGKKLTDSASDNTVRTLDTLSLPYLLYLFYPLYLRVLRDELGGVVC